MKNTKNKKLPWNLIIFSLVLISLAVHGLYSLFSPNYAAEISYRILRAANLKDSYFYVDTGQICTQDGNLCDAAIIASGPITFEAADIFTKALDRIQKLNPDLKTVCFNSAGGRLSEGAKIASEISRRSLDTCVGDMARIDSGIHKLNKENFFTASCSSICGFIILSGNKRISYGSRFRLGTHSGSTNLDLKSNNILAEEIRTNFPQKTIKISPEQLNTIIALNFRTPSWAMYTVSESEKFELGYFTEQKGY